MSKTHSIILCQVQRDDPSDHELRKLHTKYTQLRASVSDDHRQAFDYDCAIWEIEDELIARGLHI